MCSLDAYRRATAACDSLEPEHLGVGLRDDVGGALDALHLVGEQAQAQRRAEAAEELCVQKALGRCQCVGDSKHEGSGYIDSTPDQLTLRLGATPT